MAGDKPQNLTKSRFFLGSCEYSDNSHMDSPLKASLNLDWINQFAQLGETFYTRLRPTPLPGSHWVSCNHELARSIGLAEGWDKRPGVLEAMSGSALIEGSEPLASVYSGHQFGHWAGQLGDGRAIYLGEAQTPIGKFEFQLKGAGVTPYSRSGDGRAVLRSSIREYLCSEAMHALGIPTTRALCLTGSDGLVYREDVERAAVVTRIAPSFIRFGHFEHFAATGDQNSLRQLADFVITQYSELLTDPREFDLISDHDLLNQIKQNPYALMLYRTVLKTAKLIAHWQSVGFCHGVMNTDNMSILGLTLDYGPFQFMDAYDPHHICNHSDSQGRYAFDQQPNVAYWNLYCLGQALLPLIEDKELTIKCLDFFKTAYPRFREHSQLRKLGLSNQDLQGTQEAQDLISQIEQVMVLQNVDFTIFWRSLSNTLGSKKNGLQLVESIITKPLAQSTLQNCFELFNSILVTRNLNLSEVSRKMLLVNPKYVLRNHLGEQAIQSAKGGDFSQIQILLKILSSPFNEHPEYQSYAELPPEWASSISISCSS